MRYVINTVLVWLCGGGLRFGVTFGFRLENTHIVPDVFQIQEYYYNVLIVIGARKYCVINSKVITSVCISNILTSDTHG